MGQSPAVWLGPSKKLLRAFWRYQRDVFELGGVWNVAFELWTEFDNELPEVMSHVEVLIPHYNFRRLRLDEDSKDTATWKLKLWRLVKHNGQLLRLNAAADNDWFGKESSWPRESIVLSHGHALTQTVVRWRGRRPLLGIVGGGLTDFWLTGLFGRFNEVDHIRASRLYKKWRTEGPFEVEEKV